MVAWRTRRRGRLPWAAGSLAVLVVGGVLLAPLYLFIRVAQAGPHAWDLMFEMRTLELLLDTLELAAAVTAAAVAIALPLAWLTTRSDLPWRRAWTVVLALPLLFPSYVAAYTLVAAAGPRGLLRDALAPLGVEQLPEIYGFSGAWLVLTLTTYPYAYLSLRAGLMGLDRSLEEAARGLGRGPAAAFFVVTLPALRPAIAAGGILIALYTLSDFGAVSILRFDSLTSAVFIQYKSSFDRSGAAALALVLVAVALVIVLLEGATRGRARYHSRNRRARTATPLGRWRVPALVLCASVAAVGVVLPLGVILTWAARGIAEDAQLRLSGDAVFSSLYASALAAVTTVGAALPVAVLAVRRPGVLSAVLERATYGGFALPGVTIALSLVFFGANFATPLYQTLALLVFAYTVRFLPEAVGASRSALLQVHPNTEEAGRGLGASASKVFVQITAPQMLPGISAGALLVFLTAMKELPITLLLSPIGFETLATDIWTATSEASFARAALPSLVLVALSAVAVLLMLRAEQFSGQHARDGRDSLSDVAMEQVPS